jgi:predicted nucleic acid-binding protein
VGLILDTSIVIENERRGGSTDELVRRASFELGEDELGLSAVSVVELTHGIYRSRTVERREQRKTYLAKAFADFRVFPLTLEIAELAGRIEGEQAAVGIAIAFEDLVIGATALHLDYGVATLNVKHFQLIPGLKIVTL